MPPPQKIPDTPFNIFVERQVPSRRAPQPEIRFPACQFLVQPVTHIFPWFVVARRQMLSHTRSIMATPFFERIYPIDRFPVRLLKVRPEYATQKIESRLPAAAPSSINQWQINRVVLPDGIR